MVDQRNEDESLSALIGRAAADGRAYADAELGYWKALVADRLANAKAAVVLGVAALVLGNAALVALLIGLILSLSSLVGPGLATLIVVGVVLIVVGLLAWSALTHVRRLTRPRDEA